MKKLIEVFATWHEDDKIWVANSPDLPGFVTEADNFEDLRRILALTVPDYCAELQRSQQMTQHPLFYDFEVHQRQSAAS